MYYRINIALLIALSGLSNPINAVSKDELEMKDSYYGLSKNDLLALEKKANKGDKNAIERVASYYSLVQNDNKTSLLWWRKLADAGDSDGIYSCGMIYLHMQDFEKAKRFLEVAKAKGHPYAVSALKDLDRASRKK